MCDGIPAATLKDERDLNTDECVAARGVFELGRLRVLRAEVARVMLALDELGLHEAAEHASMSLLSIDRASAGPTALQRSSVH